MNWEETSKPPMASPLFAAEGNKSWRDFHMRFLALHAPAPYYLMYFSCSLIPNMQELVSPVTPKTKFRATFSAVHVDWMPVINGKAQAHSSLVGLCL